MPAPRIAFLPDSFHEVNGVAHTARNFASYAVRQSVPMLVVRAAEPSQRMPAVEGVDGTVQTLDLRRGAASVPMERDLHFDPFFARHAATIGRVLRAFGPDVVHITGPSELGMAGACFAWRYGVPLVASWHTNVHEYAARRLGGVSRRMGIAGAQLEHTAEGLVLAATTRFYRLPRVLYAPNAALCGMLERRTGRRCFLMQRGVDAAAFSPAHRSRDDFGLPARLGFVGRLSVEKNVALLPRVAAALGARGVRAEWIIIGHGAELDTLRAAMPPGTLFPGVLRGSELAAAFANMDAFVFPSHTDTFGNVVLEALSSGVPAVVTPHGGPATIVRDGVTGLVADDDRFADALADLLTSPGRLEAMKDAARSYALGCSWDAIFDDVLSHYPVLGDAPVQPV